MVSFRDRWQQILDSSKRPRRSPSKCTTNSVAQSGKANRDTAKTSITIDSPPLSPRSCADKALLRATLRFRLLRPRSDSDFVKKVLVIGGTGRIGRFAVEACRRIGDLDVSTGGRAPSGEGGVQIDLGNAATFRALDNFDTIIDCADTSEVSPESCLAYCLEHGQTFLETTALPNVIQSLLRRFRSLDASTSCQGLAVLGMGLFPGVSNVAAQSLSPEGCKRLELAVRLSPFSGSGPGTAKLMTHLLFADVQYYEAGLRVERMPFTIEVDFPFMSGIERGM